ncbi:MAG: indole acetimide hydrolase, partial [Proteobacteria bacterium]|nr:indole acetimide hydrolase [Pseudomonadota bacterium]
MSDELWRLSACEAAQGIRDKRFSAEELVSSVTQRIAEHNPRLNAIVLDLGE